MGLSSVPMPRPTAGSLSQEKRHVRPQSGRQGL